MISTSLSKLVRPVADLAVHPSNPRVGNVDAIAESLDRFGQVHPIVVDSQDRIVAGNHRFLAAKKLGWEVIAAVRFPGSDEEAEAFLLADNRTADLAVYEDEKLLLLLERIREADSGLVGTGYDESFEERLRLTLADRERISEFRQVEFEKEGSYRCPKCSYEWNGDPRPAIGTKKS